MEFSDINVEKKKGRIAPDHRTRKVATKREKILAEEIGGKLQPASGATPRAKGDVRKKGKWNVELKSVQTADSFRVSKGLLHKAQSATKGNEKSALVVEFVNRATGDADESYVIMSKSDWLKAIGDTDEKSNRKPK